MAQSRPTGKATLAMHIHQAASGGKSLFFEPAFGRLHEFQYPIRRATTKNDSRKAPRHDG